MTIHWSAEARRSLRAIRKFIAQDSEFYAVLIVEKIINRVEVAARMPSRGHPVHEYPEAPLREVHEGSYRIIYRYDDVRMDIVTIVHFKEELKGDRLPKRYRERRLRRRL